MSAHCLFPPMDFKFFKYPSTEQFFIYYIKFNLHLLRNVKLATS